jgi:hypothetical protein
VRALTVTLLLCAAAIAVLQAITLLETGGVQVLTMSGDSHEKRTALHALRAMLCQVQHTLLLCNFIYMGTTMRTHYTVAYTSI